MESERPSEQQAELMRAGVRARVARLAHGTGSAARQWTPPALLAILSAGAFGPLLESGIGPAAVTSAGIGAFTSVGGNVLSDLVRAGVSRLGDGPAERAELEDEVEHQILAALQAGGEDAERLRGEIARVLGEIGAVGAAVEAAVETGDHHLQEQIATGFAALGQEFGEFRSVLTDLRARLDSIREDTDRQSAALQVSVGLQYQQSTSTRLLLEHVAAIERRTRSLAPGNGAHSVDPRWAEESPYRGLAPFRESDAPVFHGRELVTAQLVATVSQRLAGTGMLVVTGASGAGKSSLLRAGLLPAIGRGELSRPAADWPRCVLDRPTGSPLARLATLLAGFSAVDAPALLRALTDRPEDAALLVRQAVEVDARRRGSPADVGATGRLILVVDQFEEIFAVDGDREEAERAAFVAALHAAAGGPVPPALVVIAVRGDFIDRCARHPELATALRQGPFVVGPMADADLRRAITGPAATAGLDVEPELVDAILGELGGAGAHEIGVLPLLSQAMLTTWRHRDGDRLTGRAYALTGGVSRAVATSADAVYDALTEPQRAVTRELFQRLTVVTAAGRLARRTVETAELNVGADLAHVLESYAKARLIVIDEDQVQIAHDVLLHAWPRLSAWLEPDLTGHALYGRLREDATIWDGLQRPVSYLYRGEKLAAIRVAEARRLTDTTRFPALSQTESEFLATSVRAETRNTRARRAALAAMAVLTVAALVAAVGALRFQNMADGERDQAISRLLTARADQLRGSDPVLSGLLSAAAWRYARTDEARYGMVTATTSPARAVLRIGTDRASATTLSPNGAVLAVGGRDGTVRLWNAATHRPLTAELTGHTGGVSALAFSPDGTILATGDGDVDDAGAVRLWNTSTWKQIGRPLTGHSTFITDLKFSRDGTKLVSADLETVRAWDPSGWRPTGPPLSLGRNALAEAKLRSVTISADARTLATAVNGSVTLWDLAHRRMIGTPIKLSGYDMNAVQLALSPDGTVLAVGGTKIEEERRTLGLVGLWNTRTQRRLGAPTTIDGNQTGIYSVAFNPDGKVFATGSQDGSIRLWALSTRRLVADPYRGHTDMVTGMVFNTDGTLLLTDGIDGTARLWATTMWRQTGPPLRVSRPVRELGAVGLNQNGTLLAVGRVNVEGARGPRLNGSVEVRDTRTGRLLSAPLQVHDVGLLANMAISPDGTVLVATGLAGSLEDGIDVDARLGVFDMVNRRRLALPPTGDGPLTLKAAALSPDGRALAVLTNDFQVWDTRAWRGIRKTDVRSPDDMSVMALALSRRGDLFVGEIVGSGTGVVWQRDPGNWSRIGDPFRLATAPMVIAVSHDGTTLAVGDEEGALHLVDRATKRQITTLLTGSKEPMEAVAFGPDDKSLIAGSLAGGVRTWRIDLPSDPLRSLCALARGAVTAQELRRYLPTGEPARDPCA